MEFVMPVVYQIYSIRRIVYVRGFGVVTDEELLGHNRELKTDPDFDPTFNQLLDFTEAVDMKIRTETIRRITRSRISNFSSRREIVVDTTLQYGLSRMFQNLRLPEDENIRVFFDIVEARKWLGLTE